MMLSKSRAFEAPVEFRIVKAIFALIGFILLFLILLEPLPVRSFLDYLGYTILSVTCAGALAAVVVNFFMLVQSKTEPPLRPAFHKVLALLMIIASIFVGVFMTTRNIRLVVINIFAFSEARNVDPDLILKVVESSVMLALIAVQSPPFAQAVLLTVSESCGKEN